MSALGTVVALGVALPFAAGVTPAYAQAQLRITKTHQGDFARGGQGVYRITVSNPGSESTRRIHVTDEIPGGLTGVSVQAGAQWLCSLNAHGTANCDTDGLGAGQTSTILLTVNVAEDAPCSITNRVTVAEDGDQPPPVLPEEADSDVTTVTGGECGNGGNGGGSGSILPINLSGVFPMFNNISINHNIDSPNASNNTSQNFGLNAP